jgi:uncharacterized protein (TIGR03000 family)
LLCLFELAKFLDLFPAFVDGETITPEGLAVRFRHFVALFVVAAFAASASAQVYIGVGTGSSVYPTVVPFPNYPYGYFGYFPGEFGTQWSNGFNRYGPPVPTYGPTPGQFGGSDARLNYTRLYDPRPFTRPPVTEDNVIRPTFAEIKLILPAKDAKVAVNEIALKQTGNEQSFRATNLPQGVISRISVRVKWSDGGRDRELTQNVDVRGGQQIRVDLSRSEGTESPTRIPPPKKVSEAAPTTAK